MVHLYENTIVSLKIIKEKYLMIIENAQEIQSENRRIQNCLYCMRLNIQKKKCKVCVPSYKNDY